MLLSRWKTEIMEKENNVVPVLFKRDSRVSYSGTSFGEATMRTEADKEIASLPLLKQESTGL